VAVPAEVIAFEHAARRFCAWAEADPRAPDVELHLAMRYVTDVYAAALMLPETDPQTEGPDRQADESAHEALYRRFLSLPFQYYGVVFDTSTLPPEEALVGDVADDLLDIYKELKCGLLHYEAGDVSEAVFQWRFSWGIHWGRHATNALRAMHCVATEAWG